MCFHYKVNKASRKRWDLRNSFICKREYKLCNLKMLILRGLWFHVKEIELINHRGGKENLNVSLCNWSRLPPTPTLPAWVSTRTSVDTEITKPCWVFALHDGVRWAWGKGEYDGRTLTQKDSLLWKVSRTFIKDMPGKMTAAFWSIVFLVLATERKIIREAEMMCKRKSMRGLSFMEGCQWYLCREDWLGYPLWKQE